MTTTMPATSDTMRAVVKRGEGVENVVVADVPVPGTLPGLVKVRVVATGICGSDVHVAHDDFGYEAPVVMGHEILGRVTEAGSPEDEHWVGTRVACETYFSTCERCDMCRSGRRNLCRDRRSLGSFENGGFAPYIVMPVINLHALPDRLDEYEGVLTEPLACVAHCLLDPPVVDAGDRVLVTGPGAMGQLAAQVARVQGGDVTLAGLPRDAERLAVAEDLGIRTTTDAVEDEAFDVVIECSGTALGAADALRAAARGARYVQIGIFGREVQLPFDQVLVKELRVSSGFSSTPESWRRAIKLIRQGRVVLSPLVTARILALRRRPRRSRERPGVENGHRAQVTNDRRCMVPPRG
ncbi:alcohol dehydrogenase catalytic domain-containing protein [Microbacterium sp. KHB019]|uniref:alcohol dehydrogenase catalytic domain-containing protein n=1 Tax=Microbacterium sp. KHB019 TaxID=3129770 RepID=UPI00307B04B6